MITSRQEKMHDVQEEIFKNEMKAKRKAIIKKTVKITLTILIIVIAIYLYISRISTHSIIVREERLESKELPYSFNSYKIIFFSDLYYKKENKKDLDKLIKLINERNPDLVLYDENLISETISNKEKEYLISKLSSIKAVSGKYALAKDEEEKKVLMQSGFNIINDTQALIYKGESEEAPILLTGIITPGNIKDESNIGYNIMMLENPDDADKVYYNADLILSGKSLNGEICLVPDLCLYKEETSKKYFKKYYKINKVPLYISGGIGLNKYPFRFNARPSIYFFRLTSKQ